MDSVTHALMGAAAAVSLVARNHPCTGGGNGAGSNTGTVEGRRLAAVAGAVAGVLPDADVLIQSGDDALLVLDYHRHFTHALAFVPLGALVAALLLWPWLRRRMEFPALYFYCLAGYLLHPLLDACTSYGTRLWLPFSDDKAAWSVIAVVDPLFTLLLAVSLFISLRRAFSSSAALWGLLAGVVYLSLGVAQQQRVEAAARTVASARGHVAQQLEAKPTLGNLLLWRSLYRNGDQVQVDAFHAGASLRHYAGESAALLDAKAAGDIAAGDARRLHDIERFRRMSEGFIVRDPRHGDMIGDARYAMLPTRIAPLWGIRWGESQDVKNTATELVSQRSFTPEMRSEFFAMLRGRELMSAAAIAPAAAVLPLPPAGR